MAESVPKAVPKPKVTGSITIDDPQVIKLLTQKDEEVKKGREVSAEIDAVQKRIDELTEKEYKITEKIEPKELVEKGDKLRDQINELVKELEQVAQDIRKTKLAAIPKDMEKEHLELNSKREKLEQGRNKIALKIQKIKDRLIPKLQKHAKGQLDEFEDLLSAELKDGKAHIEKFNHLDEWKRQWLQKNKK